MLAAYQLNGRVGTEWQFAGLGKFFGSDTTDMLLRNSNTGGFEVYDISNNNITNAAFLGGVGLEWQVSGFGNFSSNPGETDMMLRNVNTGGFEVYDINNNQVTGASFMGAVGLEWGLVGFGTNTMILRNTISGVNRAHELQDQAHERLTAAIEATAETRAITMEGLRCKARVSAKI